MSRPARPHPAINRKEWMENHLINRRNREDATRSSWKSTAKYFQTCEVKTKKYAELSSPESYLTSMNAYVERKRQEDEEKMLNVRRNKLARLFREENEKYRAELKGLVERRFRKTSTPVPLPDQPESSRAFSPLPPFHADILSPHRITPETGVRMEAAPEVQPSSVEHRIQPVFSGTGRDGSSKRMNSQQCEASVSRRTESAAQAAEPTVVERIGSSTPKVEATSNCRCEKVPQPTRRNVDDLVESVKWSEREATALKQEYAALQHALGEMQRLSEQRLSLNKKLQRVEPTSRGNKLRQPYKIQIQAESHPVQHLMEFDLKFIETMLSILRLIDDKDFSLCDDLGQIHARIMQNLKVEQYELLQSECLFHEEAERMWNRKVGEWEEERVSREALVEKARRLIESKVQARLATNLERQQGNITSREKMLGDLDVGNCDQTKGPSKAVGVENETALEMERLHL